MTPNIDTTKCEGGAIENCMYGNMENKKDHVSDVKQDMLFRMILALFPRLKGVWIQKIIPRHANYVMCMKVIQL
jgi:hypothetical protein